MTISTGIRAKNSGLSGGSCGWNCELKYKPQVRAPGHGSFAPIATFLKLCSKRAVQEKSKLWFWLVLVMPTSWALHQQYHLKHLQTHCFLTWDHLLFLTSFIHFTSVCLLLISIRYRALCVGSLHNVAHDYTYYMWQCGTQPTFLHILVRC